MKQKTGFIGGNHKNIGLMSGTTTYLQIEYFCT
jgi:hypothetical protein